MYCIGCGRQIDEHAQFCDFCGAAQVPVQKNVRGIFCIKCGKRVPEDSEFCIFCGAPQKQVTQAAELPPVEVDPLRENFCIHCGKKLAEHTAFCIYCGQSQWIVQQETAAELKQEPVAEPPAERYCIQCGKPLGEGSKFCMHCGTLQQERTGPVPPLPPIAAAQPAMAKNDKKVWIIVLCAVAGFSLLMMLLLAVSCSGRRNSYNSYTPAPSYSFEDSSDYGGSSSSSSSSSSTWEDDDDDDFEVAPAPSYSSRVDCPYCSGGNCNKCGGDGYVYSSASDEEDRNCTGAYCSWGRCTYCGGDGWRD